MNLLRVSSGKEKVKLPIAKSPITGLSALVHAPRLHGLDPALNELLVLLSDKIKEWASHHVYGLYKVVVRDVGDRTFLREAVKEQRGSDGLCRERRKADNARLVIRGRREILGKRKVILGAAGCRWRLRSIARTGRRKLLARAPRRGRRRRSRRR